MADYVKRTWVVEDKWTCDSCGAENLGRHMACQKCGSPKEKQEKDVASGPSAPKVTDPELLRLANQGANWVCAYCGGQVRDEHGKCVKNCGAPRSSDTPPLSPQGPVPVPKPMPTGVPGPGVTRAPTPDWSVRSDRRAPKNVTPKWPWIAGGLGIAGLIGLLVWLLTPWEETVTVSALKWEYREDLRQRKLTHEEDWQKDMPASAFNTSCSSKYYGDEDCNPHNCNAHSVSYECNCSSYECNCRQSCSSNGNGFSTCSETCSTCQRCSTCNRTEYDTCYDRCAVYKQWCAYDYYKWPIVQTQQTAGTAHDEHWPGLIALPIEQKLERFESYEVTFVKPKEDPWKYRAKSLADFQKFEQNALWLIEVNRIRSVTPLHRIPQ
jgi:hypothetical protein